MPTTEVCVCGIRVHSSGLAAVGGVRGCGGRSGAGICARRCYGGRADDPRVPLCSGETSRRAEETADEVAASLSALLLIGSAILCEWMCRRPPRAPCLRASSRGPADWIRRAVASVSAERSRENCKYLHPPPHLKTQLEINGRNNLIQQKNMAMLAQQMQLANAMLPGTQLQPVPMFSIAPSLATNATAAAAFNPYLCPMSPGLMQAEILPSAPMLMTGNPNIPVPAAAAAAAAQKLMRTDRLEVCREYQRGNCTRGENDCRFAHPSDSTMIDTNDNTVTVCMDYIKGRCSREKCKYFHPPAHLQAKIKAAQHQVNQAAAAAAMGIPAGVLPPLPKRPTLEKTNGATAMFNAGMFQYQQALANMQFQQQAAFIPSGSILCMTPATSVVPMMHGATPATVSAATTSATSVPFATATANQIPMITADHLTSHKYLTQM
ncbi:hypothetical protein SKAU_G00078530 [Synaphobranchus kaupii]|uniref:C3H1-type domain-containing protein n=1 Tax=Synaphobranchus kaupii TaxID=118154 RepID=A0A9Q1FV79_SYNKA|nr:hypothetical protein SKAU_G00078530 [Synaphobranchus kaupii]